MRPQVGKQDSKISLHSHPNFQSIPSHRNAALGGIAQGTVEDVSRASALPKMPNSEQRWEPLVKAVHSRLVAASAQAREFSEGLDDDMATQDVYVEVMRGLDKWAWMLEAHLG